jgi:hypothetical protein
MSDEQADDVGAALAILRDAGFPVERIRILPATAPEGAGKPEGEGEDSPPIDRTALLSACLAILADGGTHAAKDIARDLRASFPGVTRKLVNSVLAAESRDNVAYDRATFTYRLGASGEGDR